MKLVPFSGKVSHLNQISSTSSNILHGRGSIKTSHKTTFRVDGRPVEVGGTHNLGDGDPVTVVAIEKGGTHYPLAFRNDATRIEHVESASYIWGILFMILGVFMIGIYIGIPVMIGAGYLLYKTNEMKKAIADAVVMLRNTPAATAAVTA